ncbi:hypothetical protein PENANT_c047G10697 [Penicillium antarcticum]|uniref:Uncharacterized protein n=1 Tax=Penicillium antarcticum TaxID=416450 RepID=A0A1V6PRT0_9EURO|nr:uncharacterized protein N7508_005034 [Penicillium antarcticum]KAJ5306019.1 hypothetical protein N7508_005034 [Penicillium antarcticum]OQD79621.1 hypothetical protein PENANT_c047G10697 [Penicillium antarcticum]
MATFNDLTSYGLGISPRECIGDDEVVQSTSCIIWSVVLLFAIQFVLLHVAVVIVDRFIQLFTPRLLTLVICVCAELEDDCDDLNLTWLAWLLNIVAKISTTEDDRQQQKELIKEQERVLYKDELRQHKYDYLVHTLGHLETQAANETLTADQVQTTCDLDFELSVLSFAAANTADQFRQLEIHRRDGAWIRADRRSNNRWSMYKTGRLLCLLL